ncbi:MAG: hypothetical protein IJA12_00415 [Oscillospiraceae bacterium]|nr:hypothetical protein [Oscillospiraceae bacterium]
MDIIDAIRNDSFTEKLLKKLCDFQLCDELTSKNEKIFAKSHCIGDNESYNKYVLLDNGVIGFISRGNDEVEGCIAENLTDFFELIINYPDFLDFVSVELFNGLYEELFYKENEILLKKLLSIFKPDNIIKHALSEQLGIAVDDKTALNSIYKFYSAVKKGISNGYGNASAGNIMIYPFVADEEMEVFSLKDWVDNWIIYYKDL